MAKNGIHLNTIIDDAVAWLKDTLLHGNRLDKWFNEYCDANNEPEGDREQLIKYINGLTRITKWCFGKTYSVNDISSRFDKLVSSCSEGLDISDIDDRRLVAKRVAEKIINPFKNWDDCEWLPISKSICVTYQTDTKWVEKVDATIGQKLVLMFFIKGNNTEINWQDIYYALS